MLHKLYLLKNTKITTQQHTILILLRKGFFQIFLKGRQLFKYVSSASVYFIDYEQFPDLVYVNLIMIFKDLHVFDVLKIVKFTSVIHVPSRVLLILLHLYI